MTKLKAKFGFKPVKNKLSARQKKLLDPKLFKGQFTQDLITEVVKKAAVERQQALVAEIIKRLKDAGYIKQDETDENIQQFFKDRLRISNVKTPGDELKSTNYVFLDYVNNENQGHLVIWYTENMEVETKFENDKVKMTIA